MFAEILFSYTIFLFISVFISPKRIFEEEVKAFMPASSLEKQLITNETISNLPEPVQRYLHYAGYVGQSLTDVSEILWPASKIKLGPNKSWTNLETRQFNFVSTGSRLAYMKAHLAWMIPFEGRDKYHLGQGHMLGTLGRTIKIFDNNSHEVTLGGAVIVLAESLLEPSIALQDYISWESINRHKAKGTFRDGELKVSGTFIFNDVGEYIRFESSDRPYEVNKGVYEFKPFSIDLEDYHEVEGLRIAGQVFATWHLEKGDFTYWDGRISRVKRNAALTSTTESKIRL